MAQSHPILGRLEPFCGTYKRVVRQLKPYRNKLKYEIKNKRRLR
jgi:hypothetical protein